METMTAKSSLETTHAHDVCAGTCRANPDHACGNAGCGNHLAPELARVSEEESRELVESLVESKLYQDYERAFSEATGMPVTLRSIDAWQLPHHGKRHENDFCELMAGKSKTCSACLQVQEELGKNPTANPKTVICPMGLTDSVVPVTLGERLVGFLQTGQVFRKRPTEHQFEKAQELLKNWGLNFDGAKLRTAYMDSRVVAAREYDSMLRLLTIFAQHLSMLANQIMVQKQNSEPPVITKAKEFIHKNQNEELSLSKVAAAVHTSTYYFCKLFKKATGLNFTDYVSRVRIERAKNLLLNPNLRISEIAYEVGFQSLTHFNRVFRRVAGQTPTAFRKKVGGA